MVTNIGEHLKTDPPGKENYDRSDDDSSIDCKRRRTCGASICEHGRQRSQCIDCKKSGKGGTSICEHGRRRTRCIDCRKSGKGAAKPDEQLCEDAAKPYELHCEDAAKPDEQHSDAVKPDEHDGDAAKPDEQIRPKKKPVRPKKKQRLEDQPGDLSKDSYSPRRVLARPRSDDKGSRRRQRSSSSETTSGRRRRRSPGPDRRKNGVPASPTSPRPTEDSQRGCREDSDD